MINNTFRVFVSSTFRDISVYRDALNTSVFPEIEEFCETKSASFHPIDLRWGIREEAGLNNETLKVCLSEIDKCRALSPKPNFLILVKGSYGWTPPPYSVPKTEMDAIISVIKKSADSAEQLKLINEWYELDENSIPAEYVLKKRHGRYVVQSVWGKTENKLRDILLAAASLCDFSSLDMVKYYASATEQEIYRGLLSHSDITDNAYAVLIEDEDDKDSNVTKLKEKIRSVLPPERIFNATKDTDVKLICESISIYLKDTIQQQIDKQNAESSNGNDRNNQRSFLESALENYTHRAVEENFCKFASELKGKVGCLNGTSGSGKTTLMAYYIKRCENDCFFVFAGTSNYTYSILEITEQLIREIRQKYNLPQESSYMNYDNAAVLLQKTLSDIPDDRQITIAIDSLEKITDFGSLQQSVFNIKLTENQAFIVSTTEENSKFGITPDMSKTFVLNEMDTTEAEQMLLQRLSALGRKVSDSQLMQIRKKFNVISVLPIYVYVLVNEALTWKSGDNISAEAISETEEEMVLRHFERLSDGIQFGPKLFWHTVGYIAVSQLGLTDKEMISLLRQDIQVVEESKNEYWESNELPYVVWSRLFCEIKNYLSAQISGEYLLMKFKHTVIENAVRKHLSDEEIKDLCVGVADYFSSQPLYLGDENAKKTLSRPNKRVADELYEAMMESGEPDRASRLSESVKYCDICIRSGKTAELLIRLKARKSSSSIAADICDNITQNFFHISRHPSDYLSIACSDKKLAKLPECAKLTAEHDILLFSQDFVESETGYIETYFNDITRLSFAGDDCVFVVRDNRINVLSLTEKSYLKASYIAQSGTIRKIEAINDRVFVLENGRLVVLQLSSDRFVILKTFECDSAFNSFSVNSTGTKVLAYGESLHGNTVSEVAELTSTPEIYDIDSGQKTTAKCFIKQHDNLHCVWLSENEFAFCFNVSLSYYRSTLKVFNVQTGNVVKKRKIKNTYSISASNGDIAANHLNSFTLIMGKKRLKGSYFYPKIKKISIYQSTNYSVVVSNASSIEVIFHKTRMSYSVDTKGIVNTVVWDSSGERFAVLYADGKIKVFNVNEIDEQNALIKMPLAIPFIDSFKIKRSVLKTLKSGKKSFFSSLITTEEILLAISDVGDLIDKTTETMKFAGNDIPWQARLSCNGNIALWFPTIDKVRIVSCDSEKIKMSFRTDWSEPSDLFGNVQSWSSDGRYYCFCLQKSLRILDTETRKWIVTYKPEEKMTIVCAFFIGSRLNAILKDGRGIVFDCEADKKEAQEVAATLPAVTDVFSTSFLPVSFGLFIHSTEGSICTFNDPNNQKYKTEEFESSIFTAGSMNSDKLVYCGDSLVLDNGKEAKIISNAESIVSLYTDYVNYLRGVIETEKENPVKTIKAKYRLSHLYNCRLFEIRNCIFVVSTTMNTVHIFKNDSSGVRCVFNYVSDATILDAYVNENLEMTVVTNEQPFIRNVRFFVPDES